MRLFTILYGNGSDQPLLSEENLPFGNIDDAVKHAERTIERLISGKDGGLSLQEHFALVDELQGEQRRIPFRTFAAQLTDVRKHGSR